MNKKVCVFYIFFMIIIISCSSVQKSSSDWKHIDKETLAKDNWRTKDLAYFTDIDGDFDGNGKTDKAYIARSDSDRQIALVVIMNGTEVFILDKLTESDLSIMGIKKTLPGKYVTACGKGYFECSNGDLPEIEISSDSIEFFKNEGASSLFYWNNESRVFNRIWISD
jgi:hypothetical protein